MPAPPKILEKLYKKKNLLKIPQNPKEFSISFIHRSPKSRRKWCGPIDFWTAKLVFILDVLWYVVLYIYQLNSYLNILKCPIFMFSCYIEKNILKRAKVSLASVKNCKTRMGGMNHQHQLSYDSRNDDGNILETNGLVTIANGESRSTIERCSGNKLVVKLLEIM